MPIPLPDLDDRSYADLLDEARALLPSLAPEWTNHNPSDPGVALVELFAWLAEMLVWRANQIPDANLRAFLKLLNGPGWRGRGGLHAQVRATLAKVREGYRAVTPGDYERLATTAFNVWLAAARVREAAGRPLAEWYRVTGLSRGPGGLPRDVAPIARARCVPRRGLNAGSEAERARDRPGEVSVLVLPACHHGPATGARDDRPPPFLSGAAPPRASDATRAALWGFLEERRLLATRVHVVAPAYVPVRLEVVVVRRPDAHDPAPPAEPGAWAAVPAADVRRGVLEAAAAWLDPLVGGLDARGWPFGRDVHLSDLYPLLAGVQGVDFVAELRLSSTCTAATPGCVAAAQVLHPETGEQVGLALAAHHLPWAVLRPEDVHVAAAVVPVEVVVSLTPAAGTGAAALERAVGRTVRRVLGGFGKGPNGDAAVEVPAASVRDALRTLPEVDADKLVYVRFQADPARLDGTRQAVRFGAGEIAGAELALHADGRPL